MCSSGQAFLIDYSNLSTDATVKTTGFPHTFNYIDSYFGYSVSMGDIDGDGHAGKHSTIIILCVLFAHCGYIMVGSLACWQC